MTDLAMMGTIYIKYNDLRESETTFSKLQQSKEEWNVQYIGAKHFIFKYQPQDFFYTSEYDGQMVMSAFYQGQRQHFHIDNIQELVKALLCNFGELFSFDVISCDFPAVICKAEFFNATAAVLATTQLRNLKIPVGCSEPLIDDLLIIRDTLSSYVTIHPISAPVLYNAGTGGR